MTLDLSSLQKSIIQLEDALELCHSEMIKSDPRLALHMRAATIQAFEYTYELSYKMLKRFLETTESNPSAINDMTFNEIIRAGFEKGLLKNSVEHWKEFRRNRGTTSHTYDEDKAKDVFEEIPAFLNEVRFLLNELQLRQRT